MGGIRAKFLKSVKKMLEVTKSVVLWVTWVTISRNLKSVVPSTHIYYINFIGRPKKCGTSVVPQAT